MSLLANRIAALILMGLLFSSCSIYKSQGRNQFENATPGKLQAQSLRKSAADLTDTTLDDLGERDSECWLQPSQDSIWHLRPSKKYTLKTISTQVIEVCEAK